MRKILIVLLVAFSASEMNAQYNWDVGIKLGAANYLGEMGGLEKTRRDFILDMKLSQTRWAMGAFARYRFSPLVSVSGSFMYGRIQGDDKLSTNRGRYGRNQNFRNDLMELALQAEVTFYNSNDVGGTGRYRLDFYSYAFLGVAGYYSNPKGSLDGNTWVPLQPLMTEGVEYSKFGLAIPTGLGCYFTSDKKHRFGFEAGWRLTFDDYLDDVSGFYVSDDVYNQMSPEAQAFANRRPELGNDPSAPDAIHYGNENKRGDPTHNDTYMFMTFSYSYVIRGRSNFYRQKYPWFLGRKSKVRKSRTKF